MKKIGDIGFNLDGPVVKSGKVGPRNHRDELLEYFLERLGEAYRRFTKRKLTMRQLAVKTAHLGTKDLAFLKSVCLDAERRGKSFSLVFWSELKVKP